MVRNFNFLRTPRHNYLEAGEIFSAMRKFSLPTQEEDNASSLPDFSLIINTFPLRRENFAYGEIIGIWLLQIQFSRCPEIGCGMYSALVYIAGAGIYTLFPATLHIRPVGCFACVSPDG